MKRKLLALLLAAGMTAGLAVPAMAESLPEEAQAKNDDVWRQLGTLYPQDTAIIPVEK